MVNPRLLCSLRQRVLEHMRRLAGSNEEAVDDLKSGLSPSESIEADHLLSAALSHVAGAASARHPRPPSSNKLSPRRAPVGRAPAPRPPTTAGASSSSSALSEDDLVSIAKKFLAARGIGIAPASARARPASSSAAVAKTVAPASSAQFKRQQQRPASSPSQSQQQQQQHVSMSGARGSSDNNNGDDDTSIRSPRCVTQQTYAVFQEKQRQLQEQQAARQKALQDAITAAVLRQKSEAVQTHERVFPGRRTSTTVEHEGGVAAALRSPVLQDMRGGSGGSSSEQHQLPPAYEMMHQLSELRGGHGRGRPQSVTDHSWSSQGIGALEKMRDRLVHEQQQRRQQKGGGKCEFFFDESGSSGALIEQIAGWTPERRDHLKSKFDHGRESLCAGLTQQLKERARLRENKLQRMRDENQMYSEFILENRADDAERKRRKQMQLDRAAADAHSDIQRNLQRRKQLLDHEHDREKRELNAAVAEAREAEEAKKEEDLRKRERLRRELQQDANNAMRRKEEAARQKQEQEAAQLAQIQRELQQERQRNEERLRIAWDKHKRHAEALRRETEARTRKSDTEEKAHARALADAARAEEEAERALRHAELQRKREKHREQLMHQMYVQSARQRATKEREREEANHRIGEDTAVRADAHFAQMHSVLEKQNDFRRYLELQQQVASLKFDNEDERLQTRLKARRTMANLCDRPRWSEAALEGTAKNADEAIVRRPESGSSARHRLW